MRSIVAATLCVLTLSVVSSSHLRAAGTGTLEERDALLVNVSARDLDRILGDALSRSGAPVLEGASHAPARGLSDLRYHARFGEPRLKLAAGGMARLELDLLEADLAIGRIERRVAGSRAFCEDTGAILESGHAVALALDLGLALEAGALRITPTAVSVGTSPGDFRIVEPSRCGHGILPGWLLWRLGRPQLRRKLEHLDAALLRSAQRSADGFNRDEGQLAAAFSVRGLDERQEEIRLVPTAIDTGQGSLFVSLAATTAAEPPAATTATAIGPPASTFVAVSESFLNVLLARRFAGERGARDPAGSFAKLLRSDACLTLVPGLRDLPSRAGLALTLRFPESPRVELVAGTPAPRIRLLLANAELVVSQVAGDGPARELGTLHIDAARIGVVPFASPVGGIAFETVENAWELSSSGIAFDEPVLAATLQELIFGEIFETLYEPLLREALAVGSTRFAPDGFTVDRGYLFVSFRTLERVAVLAGR